MKTLSDKTNLTAAEILAIAADAPEKLFSGDLTVAKSEYHALSRRWHPDYNPNPNATEVFQRIAELYRKTQKLIETNRWRGAGILELLTNNSGAVSRKIPYFKSAKFELGDVYMCETEIVFSIEREFADLFENAQRRIASFKFANERMQKEIGRNLPEVPECFAAGERLLMVLPKPADMILLEDLREYFGGAIDARHVAWIVGSLHNLACYFDYAGFVHHDISPLTIWVSPESHSVKLLGGWWFARRKGEPLSALPARTIKFAPADAVRNKRADARTDLELIRQTGRELLGASGSARLETSEKVPAAMTRWFNGATSGAAVTDYELWRNVLEMDFGKPRFCRLNIEPNAVYGKL